MATDMGPEAMAPRLNCVVLAAAIAVIPALAGAQTDYPRDPRRNPPQLPSTGPQDAATVNAQDATSANPQDASGVGGREAERRVEGALPAPATTRRVLAPWRVIPRIGVSETYTDNVMRASSTLARSDWISALSPGIRIEGAGPRVRGSLDYQLTKFLYANQSGLNNTQNSMNSEVTLEAVQDWLFVDAHARISQLNTSAFGTTTTDATGANTNRSESSVLQLSPYVRGMISGAAVYQLRYSGTTSRTSNSVVPETKSSQWLGSIKNAPSTSLLGWSVDGSTMTIHNAIMGDRDDSRIRGSLMYALYPEFHVSISEGIETNSLAGLGRQRTTVHGIGLEWSPGARTQVAAVSEKRFFGTGHSLLLSHRTPLLGLRFADTKDVSLPVQLTAGGQGTISDVLDELLRSSIPDPESRSAAVRSHLERTGIPASSPGSSGFLTSSVSILHRQQASVAMLGKTNTITLTWNRSNYQSVGGSLGLVDNVTSSTHLSQNGYSAAWAVRLSPHSSMTLVESWLNTKDLIATNFFSKLHSQDLVFLTELGRRTSMSVSARRVRFESSVVGGYTENALIGTASLRF